MWMDTDQEWDDKTGTTKGRVEMGDVHPTSTRDRRGAEWREARMQATWEQIIACNNTRNSKRATSALPVFREGIRYLIGGSGISINGNVKCNARVNARLDEKSNTKLTDFLLTENCLDEVQLAGSGLERGNVRPYPKGPSDTRTNPHVMDIQVFDICQPTNKYSMHRMRADREAVVGWMLRANAYAFNMHAILQASI
ncbi:hypothetical protein EVAR_40624_1 [Eumeta japonica]|uniref:Uncharacterized protein n=1 Tax=Eumeta variegata TaxID=151549 RepID=A0A4C1XG62_EUMVA|nr:hypothetical protein EVAR_40624_1 [Eumeta japonica]